MKRNNLLFLIILFIIFIPSARAEEYAKNYLEKYSIKEATCIYEWNYGSSSGLSTISFSNDNFLYTKTSRGVEDYYITIISGIEAYQGRIELNDFYEDDSDEFKCPNTLYYWWDTMNNNNHGQAMIINFNDSDTIAQEKMTLDNQSVKYNTVSEAEQNKDNYEILYTFVKDDNDTSYRQASPSRLYYVTFKDGISAFVDSNDTSSVWNILSGSIDTNSEVLTISLEIDTTNKTYKILRTNESCKGTEGKCVNYRNIEYETGLGGEGQNSVPVPVPFIPQINAIDNCESLLGNPDTEGQPAWYLTKTFEIIRYIAIGLVLVFTIMDFVGAVTSSDDDSLKKATSKLITRLILCVLIFLLPMLIKFILKYLNNRAIDLCINA